MPEHTIAENLARLQAAKTAIGNAIVAKGGTVNSGDGLEEYPADIASIETAELTSISITENGVYSSGDAEEVESSTLPIVIEADGTLLLDFLISGNMSQSGTPTPSSPIQPQETGDLETTGEHSGQYKIPISSANTTTPVYLGEVPTTRKIKKLVLDGTETYTYELAYTRFIMTIPNAKIEGLRLTQVYCTHYESIYDGRALGNVPDNSIYSSDVATDRFFIKTTSYTSTADFKDYLAQQYAAGTPVTIWYILAEPETAVVNEPLRKIGDYADTLSMEQAGVDIQTNTSPSTTTIDIPTTLSPSLLYVKYNTLSTTSGYNHVDVNVPNTYSSSDEGKVVSNGELTTQTAKPDTITANNTYDTTNYNSVTVDVENSYTASDEGKVVNNGALVSQTAKPTEITVNDTYDTTMYNSVTVDVANTYTQSDEGKVVSNGELVAQTTKPDVIVENGAYDTTLYDSVNVYVSPELQIPDDVNFYDYDGTIVKSYTAAEFANISELPDNPSHEGLTAQGWNWSLSDAKAYVVKYGKLEIGQMYVTSDGKTRIYITLAEGRISPILQLYLNDNSELDIDWGDGSSHSTFTTTSAGYRSERHNYATAGDYVIAITVITGSFVLQSSSTVVSSILWNGNNNTNSPDRAYNNSIKKIEIGTGMPSVGAMAFRYCCSLSSVTIPNSVTSIGNSLSRYCYSLSSITIPDSVTTIGDEAFFDCSLSSITIPDSVTTIGIATLCNCPLLSSVTIPDSVTSIGNMLFSGCYSLSSITIPDLVTTIGNEAFYYCYSLSSITIPDSVTTIGDEAFHYCHALSSITIPDSVTTIGNGVFYQCYSLSSVTIGNSVTSIGNEAFYYCSYMESIKFKSTTPPTVANSKAWYNVPRSCIIYVPAGTLNAYKTATNYPNPSTYTYVEY